MGEPAGLRERKKQETRQRISDIATSLFTSRGFDEVTVAEVAEAANVSKMTVFNYFTRKEDLFFDRLPEATTLLTGAVLGRPPGVSPVAAVRAYLLDLIARGHPLSGVGSDYTVFWRTVLASPALRARAREALEELEDALAEALSHDNSEPDAPGADADGGGNPEAARMTAALIIVVLRSAYRLAASRQLAGEAAEVIAADQPALINRWFDAIDRAIQG